MTDEAYPSSAAGRAGEETSGWAAGFIQFAVLSAIANFLWLPSYPFWALTVITLDVFVIWAIAAHGGELRERY